MPRRVSRGAALTAAIITALTGCAGAPTAPPSIPGTAWPAFAAALAYADSGPIATHDDAAAQPIASLAKLVSALMVLEAAPLAAGADGPDVTVDDGDVADAAATAQADGVVIPVTAGQILSERTLLEGSLIASASNFADMLVGIAFTADAYPAAASAWLERNGLHDTHVTDGSGLDGGATGTAADMVRLGRLAMEHPVVAEIVAMPEITVAGHTFSNTNLLLDAGFTGVKTGTDSLHHLIFSRPLGDRMLIGAVLGAPTAAHARRAAVTMTDAVLVNTDP